jgi:hypothetical protein
MGLLHARFQHIVLLNPLHHKDSLLNLALALLRRSDRQYAEVRDLGAELVVSVGLPALPNQIGDVGEEALPGLFDPNSRGLARLEEAELRLTFELIHYLTNVPHRVAVLSVLAV